MTLSESSQYTSHCIQSQHGRKGEVGSKSLEGFLTEGYTHQQGLEVTLGIAMKTLSNYANGLMNTPLDEAFKPEAWQK